MTALDMFRMGKDTLEIAEAMGRPEAEIEQLIHLERTAKRETTEQKKRGAR